MKKLYDMQKSQPSQLEEIKNRKSEKGMVLNGRMAKQRWTKGGAHKQHLEFRGVHSVPFNAKRNNIYKIDANEYGHIYANGLIMQIRNLCKRTIDGARFGNCGGKRLSKCPR